MGGDDRPVAVTGSRVVLDTHVWWWWLVEPGRLSDAQRAAVDGSDEALPLIVPAICLWEIATLVSLGRIVVDRPLAVWLAAACAPPLVRVQEVTPEIAAEVAALPDSFHRDPGDRLIVATARILGLPLVTRDRRIIESGLVRTIG